MSTRRAFIKAAILTGASGGFSSACQRLRGSGPPDDSGDFQRFRSSLKGRVILPTDSDYEKARRVSWWNPATNKRPAMLVRCDHDADVARCIDFARQRGLKLAVRSGGHSFMGWGIDDGLVIDLSRLKDIVVNPAQKTIRAGAGVIAAEMLTHAARHGLAPVLGQCGTVGAGLALGGGLGWLSGTRGATCDNLLSARLITADTNSVAADAQSNPDLYWAIRGGGGNFGVATSLEYQLHPVGQVLAGGFTYPLAEGRAMLRFFRDFMSAAPDELQALAYLAPGRGGIAMIVLVYSGDLNVGEKLIDDFRRFRRPQRDWVQRRAYADTYTMPPYDGGGEGPPCASHAIRGSYLERLSDEAIDTVLSRSAEAPPACGFGFNFDHYMHGEVCRVAPHSTAFELRNPGAVHLAFGMEWDEPERTKACTAWLDETWRQLQPYSGGRMYANYMSVDGEAAAKAAYGQNYERLVSIKKKFDPDNVFHRNLNIQPS